MTGASDLFKPQVKGWIEQERSRPPRPHSTLPIWRTTSVICRASASQ